MSLTKPILISGITLFLAWFLSSLLPTEFSYFTVQDEQTILTAINTLVQRFIYLTSMFLDWPMIFIVVKLQIFCFFALLSWKIGVWVMNWWKFSQ